MTIGVPAVTPARPDRHQWRRMLTAGDAGADELTEWELEKHP
jgi:hypothetical protein